MGVDTGGVVDHERFSPGNPDVEPGAPVSKSTGTVDRNLVPMYLYGNTTREITKANYIDVLGKAFADDSALVQKIQNKGFKFKELDEIIDEYKQESTNLQQQNPARAGLILIVEFILSAHYILKVHYSNI